MHRRQGCASTVVRYGTVCAVLYATYTVYGVFFEIYIVFYRTVRWNTVYGTIRSKFDLPSVKTGQNCSFLPKKYIFFTNFLYSINLCSNISKGKPECASDGRGEEVQKLKVIR